MLTAMSENVEFNANLDHIDPDGQLDRDIVGHLRAVLIGRRPFSPHASAEDPDCLALAERLSDALADQPHPQRYDYPKGHRSALILGLVAHGIAPQEARRLAARVRLGDKING